MRVALLLFENPPDTVILIAEACLRFSPQISIKRKDSIFIEIGKCSKLYKEETFLARVQVLLKRFNLKAKVAISDSIVSSVILGKYGTLDFKLLPISSFHDYLNPFLEEALYKKEIERMIDALDRLGIKTVGDFLNIRSTELPSRFGNITETLLSRVLKKDDLGWPAWIPEEKVIEKSDLPDNGSTSHLEPLLFYLKPLFDRAFSRLWARSLSASRIRLSLFLEKFSTVKEPIREWRIDFLLPQTTSRGTLPIIRERLSRDLSKKPLESSVLSLELEICESVRDHKGQKHFFHTREDTEEVFNSVISQMSEGLGKGFVFRVNIAEEAIPEKAWSKCMSEQKELPSLDDYIPLRPTRVLKSPLKVQISKDRIFIKKNGYKVLSWSCVEEIDTAWMDERVTRSYYKLEIEEKSPVWIFRNETGDYFLHGYFE